MSVDLQMPNLGQRIDCQIYPPSNQYAGNRLMTEIAAHVMTISRKGVSEHNERHRANRQDGNPERHKWVRSNGIENGSARNQAEGNIAEYAERNAK